MRHNRTEIHLRDDEAARTPLRKRSHPGRIQERRSDGRHLSQRARISHCALGGDQRRDARRFSQSSVHARYIIYNIKIAVLAKV